MAVRILVTGSRTWTDKTRLNQAIADTISNFIELGYTEFIIVHGGAGGADAMASQFVRMLDELISIDETMLGAEIMVGEECWPAEWGGPAGKRAGRDRNELMVHLGADICLAFIKDGSPGASHCADYAAKHGITTHRFVE